MGNVHLDLVEYQSAFRQPQEAPARDANLSDDLEPVVVRVPVVSHDLCRSNDILSVTCCDVITHFKLRFTWQGIPPDTA